MIDISNLTSLITAFRQETEQGSISPETLGALLQAIANQLQSATTDQEQTKLTNIYNNLLKMGNFLVNLTQGDTDRNNVLGDYYLYDPIAGVFSAQRSQVLIKQATTERAGAMRAQQVIDLNAAKKGVATLEDAVSNIESAMATTNANNSNRFDELDQMLLEMNGYIESVDGVSQTNAENIESLSSRVDNINNRAAPIRRGTITIDHTSITSPVGNYFKYNMADGHYNLVRGGSLIGQAVSYQYGNFRVFDVIGLCHINSNSFVYQDTLAHILVRVAQNGLITAVGTIDHVDLQNQINKKQDQLKAGAGIEISGNTISVNVVPETTYTLDFAASDGVISGNFDKTIYNELRQAIEDNKTIVLISDVTIITGVSTVLADGYIVIRYCVPRIQDDNATVVLSVYELKLSETTYTSKSIHKVLSAA